MAINVLRVLAYLFAIVAANVAFQYVPGTSIAGVFWHPAMLLIGAVFVLRDIAQRRIGHWVFVPMGVGLVVSYELASPVIALASAASASARDHPRPSVPFWTPC